MKGEREREKENEEAEEDEENKVVCPPDPTAESSQKCNKMSSKPP